PLTSAFLVRVKSKILPADLTTESPTTYVNTDETSTDFLETIPTSTESTLLLYSSSTLKINTSSNATIFAIILACSFSGFLLLAFVFTFLLRRRISIAYFKLPCIHSSSAAKDSRDNTPLSHSPIHGKRK
ncbi:unnamed protein product, partial [Rotaria socialis]